MVVLSVFVRAVPLRGHAALRALADRRRLNGESGSWAITGRRAPGAAVACPSRSCSPRFRMTAARLAKRGKPGGEEGSAGAGALVFAVLAGWRRIPSPSATASGSSNRLLCPDPVRHMSVISGSAELTIAYCGGLRRRLECVSDAGPAGCSRRQHGINERNTGRWGRAERRVRTGARTVALLERAVCRPLAVLTGTRFLITALTC